MILPRKEARLFELSSSPSVAEVMVKESLMNKKVPDDSMGSIIQNEQEWLIWNWKQNSSNTPRSGQPIEN